MRLQRELELKKFRDIFSSFTDDSEEHAGFMPKERFDEALTELGFESLEREKKNKSPRKNRRKGKGAGAGDEHMNFDDFVAAVLEERNTRAIESRKQAGFSHLEIVKFQGMFDSFDADRSGTMEPREVGQLLESLGFSMNTHS